MANATPFQHIQLRFVMDAPTKKPPRRNIAPNPKTQYNRFHRKEHAERLHQVGIGISEEWAQNRTQRQQDNLPEMPEALSLFLQVDPYALPIEDLRKFGIEVIGEFEDGFVLGSSSEISLGRLLGKIEKFAEGEQQLVAALWNIEAGLAWRPERILSESLFLEYPKIRDQDLMVIEIGVACLGIEHIPEHPKNRRSQYKTEEAYEKAVEKWTQKRNQAYEAWDELMYSRYEQLMRIVRVYRGEDLTGPTHEDPENFSSLPDSFSVKVRISGKGFKDIVENYPYVFDICEADGIEDHDSDTDVSFPSDETRLQFKSPDVAAPAVCVIDSGIQERHVYLKDAIDKPVSKSWIFPDADVADYVPGGHGTRVAGGVLFANQVPTSGQVQHEFWIQNARVLDVNNGMPDYLYPPTFLRQIVRHFHQSAKRTRLFNHSINSFFPCRIVHMSAWASAIDHISWENDVLFVVSAGNLPFRSRGQSVVRLAIRDHITQGRDYPAYLRESSSRIANPAQSLQAITVGSVGLAELRGSLTSFSKANEPAAYSCTGPGIFHSIKPEVVEYGGCLVHDGNTPRQLANHPEVSPLTVRSTLHGGSALGRDRVGTSFAAPKVSHILASIQKEFPEESTLLYRALLIQSARWPEWTSSWNGYDVLRHIGYGIPDLNRAVENSPYRITLITQGERRISGKQVHIYEVKIPVSLRNPVDAFDIRIDITLSYKAEPRRTRRNRRRYLSTWLEWNTSKRNESMDSFISRMIDLATEDEEPLSIPRDEGGDSINWAINTQSHWGTIRGVNRNNNTIQKDWAQIKSHEWRESFYIAVIGHLGWNRDLEATVPYSLAVSFESVNQDVDIYQRIAIENEVEITLDVEI